jgi:hypothetical protein
MQLQNQIKDFRTQVDQIRMRITKVKAEDLNRKDLPTGNSPFYPSANVSFFSYRNGKHLII